MAFDITDTEVATPKEQVTALYIGYFGRAPDPIGLQLWQAQLEEFLADDDDGVAGRSLAEIATAFSEQTESQNEYAYFEKAYDEIDGNETQADAEAFINDVYLNLFGRPADPAGLEGWTANLMSGNFTVGEIILKIIEGSGPNDKLRIENKIEASIYFHDVAVAAGIGRYAEMEGLKELAREIPGDVGLDAATLDAAKALADAAFDAGQDFLLTTAQDLLPGLVGSEGTMDTSGDDTIFGLFNADATDTFTLGDNIDGGDGFDTLALTLGGDAVDVTLATADIENIERVEFEITAADLETLDLVDVNNDYQSVSIDFEGTTRTEALEILNVNPNASIDIFDVDGDDNDLDIVLNETADPIAGSMVVRNVDDLDIFVEVDDSGNGSSDSDSYAVEFDGVMNTDGDMDWYIDDIETLDILVSSDSELENIGNYYNNDGSDGPNPNIVNLQLDGDLTVGFWDFSDDEVPSEFNITGAGDLNIEFLDDGGSLMTLDASTAMGDITILEVSSGLTSLDATLGSGDDGLGIDEDFDYDEFSADGGDGVDTLGIAAVDLDADRVGNEELTADGDFGDTISNFEELYAFGTVAAGDEVTVDLDQVDDIDYVITDGTDAAVDQLNEIQELDFAPSDASGGIVQVTILGETFDVEVAPNASAAVVAQTIVNAFDNGDFAAAQALGLVDVRGGSNADNVAFEFDSALGDIGQSVIAFNNQNTATVVHDNTVDDGDEGAFEVAVFEVMQGAGATDFFVRIDDIDGSGTDLSVEIDGGSSIDEIGQQIVDAINSDADSVYSASFDAVSNEVTLTSDNTENVGTNITIGDDGTGDGLGAGAVLDNLDVDNGTDPVDEVQELVVTVNGSQNGVFTDDSRVVIAGLTIDIPAGTTADQLGAIIVDEFASNFILGLLTDINDVQYNTIDNILTVTWDATQGDVDTTAFVFNGDNNATAANPFFFDTVQDGFVGTPAGITNLEYVTSGGTLELADANDGTTNVNIDPLETLGDADEFNIVLATSDDHDGNLNIDGVEVLNVMTEADGVQSNLNVNAADLVTLNVSGTSGVVVTGAPFTNLETVDASALDIETDEAGVSIDTANADGTVFIGSVGEDRFGGAGGDDDLSGGTGEDDLFGGAGNDSIDGGADDDFIAGGADGDILTGGAGDDTFAYFAASDSQNAEVDTIMDFVSGEDMIDLFAVEVGTGSYFGEVNGYGAVLTALAGTGDTQAIFDTDTNSLYVDVTGDGILDNTDMKIDLTGVTDLDATDFIF
jgi:Ca2+-binding RTX toxin-like protein